MLGTFRLGLAWLVMLSHYPAAHLAAGFNFGVTAVTLFYYISGYLMYHSFARYRGVKRFYLSRFLRLYPLYWFVLFLMVVTLWLAGPSQAMPLLHQDPGPLKILLNATLLADNYVFAPLQIPSMLPHPLLPPAWSLGTELQFYLLVPWLFLWLGRGAWRFYLLFILSLLFAFYSYLHAPGTAPIDANNFGYRYLPGVLWIFMAGFLHASGRGERFLKGMYVYLLFILFFIVPAFDMHYPFVREILLGALLTPAVRPLMRLHLRGVDDAFFGRLSYPVFLAHFWVFLLAEKFGFLDHFVWVALFLLSTAWVLSRLQRQVDTYRHRRLARGGEGVILTKILERLRRH